VPVGSDVAAEDASSGGLVVHRLVARTRGGVVVRGDNGAVHDGVLPESALIGVVVRVERAGRPVGAGLHRMRRPMAALVRLGFVRRWNRVRGLAGLLGRRMTRWGRTAAEAARPAPAGAERGAA
jgi:hypothetical protein